MIERALRRQTLALAATRSELRTSLENPAVPLSGENLISVVNGPRTRSGVRVTESTALRIGAVLACVRIIAESVASLPLVVYQRKEKGKDRATDHPLYQLLHDRPNPELSAMRFRELMQAHALIWGNAFAEIETNQAGTVIGLWPLLPDRTTVYRLNGIRYYTTRLPDGTIKHLSADRVFQFSGLGFDGLRGYSPIDLQRESLGLTVATEEFGARFFGNGAAPSGVFEHPKVLSAQANANLRRSLEEQYSGISNAHRLMILEEGMQWKALGIPPNHAQFLETRKFQLNEIARMFRVPPHMLADLESGASYASVEQMSLDFVTFTLRPWLVRWEQDINYDLFGSRERATYFAEHLVDGLLRGDLKSRYEAYAIARQWGWMSADDVREIENLNPLPDGQGAIYISPMNMIPADQVGKIIGGKQPQPDPAADIPANPDTPKAKAARQRALLDVADRMVKRELPQLRKLLKQGEGAWTQGLDALMRDQSTAFAKALSPLVDVILAFGSTESRALVAASDAIATDLVARDVERARAELTAAGFAGAGAVLDLWEGSRASTFVATANDYIEQIAYPNDEQRVGSPIVINVAPPIVHVAPAEVRMPDQTITVQMPSGKRTGIIRHNDKNEAVIEITEGD